MAQVRAVETTQLDAGVTNVLKNTYMLLGITIAFSAVMALVSMAVSAPYFGFLIFFGVFMFCSWMVEKNKNSTAGLFWVFALTGWLGFNLGPILSYYIGTGGIEPIVTALGGTAVAFFGASAYVLTTRKNLSAWRGTLFIGMSVAFIAFVLNYFFFELPALSLAISAMVIPIATGIIMWQTSEIIHGGERNYISATVMLFVMIYNLFISLLNLINFADD